jgi:hypothetical protein
MQLPFDICFSRVSGRPDPMLAQLGPIDMSDPAILDSRYQELSLFEQFIPGKTCKVRHFRM